jgi:hypothetical protein
MTERFLTIRQFARLGVLPEGTIRKLVKSKNLPAVYIGNRAMLPYSQCLEALNRLAALERQN